MSSRKLFWSCAILTVAAAAHVWLAALYVSRNPDSLLGRCALTGYRVSTQCVPLCRVGFTVANCAVRSTCAAVEHVAEQVAEQMAEEVASGRMPAPAAEPTPAMPAEPAACQAVPQAVAIDVPEDPEAGRLPGKIVIHEEEEAEQPAAEPVPMIEVEPAAAAPMPYCPETGEDAAPMPKTEDDAALEEWMKQFQAEQKPAEAGEESETPESNPQPKEDPDAHYQCPGCPHLHHHCPAVCPYTGRCVETIEEELIHAPTPVKGKKKTKKAMPKHQPARNWESIPAPHPDVDTMEFRPSDYGTESPRLPPA